MPTGKLKIKVGVESAQSKNNQPKVLYLCDHRACDRCRARHKECNHTSDIRHAKNFENIDGAFVEVAKNNSFAMLLAKIMTPPTKRWKYKRQIL